jgi:phosphoribosylanthranilate isomerase
MIQVAGVLNEADLHAIVDAGVELVGFPLRLGHHKPDVSESEAARLISLLPSSAQPVLITYLDRASEILALMLQLRVSIVQLHGSISLHELKRLKKDDLKIQIIKSLIVREGNLGDLEKQIEEFSDYVDFFITDTFDPQTGAMGATGKTHDWRISRRLVELSSKPLILAGGLNPNNVEEAISIVRPAGVDVHTGVERADGKKDPILIQNFVGRARRAFRALQ